MTVYRKERGNYPEVASTNPEGREPAIRGAAARLSGG